MGATSEALPWKTKLGLTGHWQWQVATGTWDTWQLRLQLEVEVESISFKFEPLNEHCVKYHHHWHASGTKHNN